MRGSPAIRVNRSCRARASFLHVNVGANPLESGARQYEVRDSAGKIVAVRTDSKGYFQIKDLRPGKYKFKTTRDGFSSVVGTVVLTKKANSAKTISIQMALGA